MLLNPNSVNIKYILYYNFFWLILLGNKVLTNLDIILYYSVLNRIRHSENLIKTIKPQIVKFNLEYIL